MKRVLITGANSYVGTNVEKWLLREPDKYHVETLDMKDPNWREFDFSKFDVVFHVAGIAHIKETRKNKSLYYVINRDLAIETAQKAKESGVIQFIFMSSMSVFGISKGVINENTRKGPNDSYGISKSEAEDELIKMANKNFKICIVRPPMIYGESSIGNFNKLVNLSKKIHVFPKKINSRSSIFILNFCEFIKKCIELDLTGCFHPQNSEYLSSYEIVKAVRQKLNKKIIFVRIFNPLLKFVNFSVVNKVFGNLTYDFSLSTYEFEYVLYSTEDSIILSIEEEEL